MTDGVRIVTIPRHNPVNAFTMGGIVRDAGPRHIIDSCSGNEPIRAIDREAFDLNLAARATAAGATLRTGALVDQIVVDEDGVTLWVGRERLRARGPASWPAAPPIASSAGSGSASPGRWSTRRGSRWTLAEYAADPGRRDRGADGEKPCDRGTRFAEERRSGPTKKRGTLGKDGRLRGVIRIKDGDASTFIAERAIEPEEPIPAPPSYRDKWRRRW